MGSRVYTVDQLLALRPRKGVSVAGPLPADPRVGSYFALWRKYNRLLAEGPKRDESTRLGYRTVMRFALGQSNKSFRRMWIKTHKTSAGLKFLPKYPLQILDPEVKFLRVFFDKMRRLSDLLDRLRSKIWGIPPKSEDKKVVKPSRKKSRTSKPFKRVRKACKGLLPPSITERPSESVIIKLWHRGSRPRDPDTPRLVGISPSVYFTRPPPKPHWVKYWYHYRRNGAWHVSEHHPYGDEGQVLLGDGS